MRKAGRAGLMVGRSRFDISEGESWWNTSGKLINLLIVMSTRRLAMNNRFVGTMPVCVCVSA